MRFLINKCLIEASKRQVALGILKANVKVSKQHQHFLKHALEIAVIKAEIDQKTIADKPALKALRETYGQLGKNVAKRVGSAEALYQRIVDRKGINTVNNVVDINNILSIASARPVGSYDLSQVGDTITFRAGLKGEKYLGLNNRNLDLEGLPVFADAKGPFGSPTSDSKRALILDDTQKIMMVVISFNGADKLPEELAFLEEQLKKYAEAKDIEKGIITADSPEVTFKDVPDPMKDLMNAEVVFEIEPEKKSKMEEKATKGLSRS